MRELGGKRALVPLQVSEAGLNAFRFADEQGQVLVLWTEGNERTEYLVQSDVAGARLFDMLGREVELVRLDDRTVSVVVGENPQFLRLASPTADVTVKLRGL